MDHPRHRHPTATPRSFELPRSLLRMAATAVLLVPVTGACNSGSSAGAVRTVRDSAGVVVVETVVEPDRRLTLVEDLRIGVRDGPEELQFSRIWDVQVVKERGEVFVLDRASQSVRVFDLEGRFLREWGREGEGPGEFRSVLTRIVVARDTAMVITSRAVHFFDVEGSHLASFTPQTGDYLSFPARAIASRSGWQVEVQELDENRISSTHRLYGFDPGEGFIGQAGVDLFRFGEEAFSVPSGMISYPLFLHRASAAYDRQGRVHLAPGDEYEVRILDPDGRLRRVHRLRSRRQRVEQWMIDEYVAGQEARCAGANGRPCPFTDEVVPAVLERGYPEYRPVIGRMWASAEGDILVRRADLEPHPFTSGDAQVYDLLSAEGEYLGRVDPPARFTPTWFTLDELWGFIPDELDVPYVVRYRIEHPAS